FRGWLRVIASSKVADFRRAEFRREHGEGGSDHQRHLLTIPEADAQQLTDETRLLYLRALELLQQYYDEPTWQVFLRVTVHDESPREVARRVGMTANAVYKIRSRILKRFRREFDGLVPDVSAAADGT